jgi:hypothetical protein
VGDPAPRQFYSDGALVFLVKKKNDNLELLRRTERPASRYSSMSTWIEAELLFHEVFWYNIGMEVVRVKQ